MGSLPPGGSGNLGSQGTKIGLVPGGLLELFQADALKGFIKEYRRIYGNKPGAVSLWQDMAIKAGIYDKEALE